MERFPKDRIAALTDGIFAVTMTLLVLDLRVPAAPGSGDGALWAALRALAPKLDDYVISFVVLCVFWRSHHRLMHRLREVDGPFLTRNLAFLLATTFVPAATAFVSGYPGSPLAAVLYGVDLAAVLLLEFLLWHRGMRELASVDAVQVQENLRRARRQLVESFGVVVAAVTVGLVEIRAGGGVAWSSYVYLLLLIVGLTGPRVRHR